MNAIHKLANLCFVAPNGNDVPAVTADPMREAHRIAMEETGPNLYQMMENSDARHSA
jgi:NAD(P)H-hydrate epimerase